MTLAHRPYVLIILDGWGYREETDANAIAQANTPTWDKLWADYPHTLISGSGDDVGLPHGQMGNSEVGHLNLGAGRMVPQELCRLDLAIKDGSFFENAVLCDGVDKAISQNKAVHIMGLLSPGGVHSNEKHIHAMVKLAALRGAKKILVHAFLDGRDTPPQSAEPSLVALQTELDTLGVGQIASICGRYYAMDRDKRWDRVELAYNMLTLGKAEYHADNAIDALHAAYQRDENDEFVKPTCINNTGHIEDGDAVVFMNFRADRARELSHALTDIEFDGFQRKASPKLATFVSLTEYAKDIKANVAYPPQQLHNVLGEYLSNLGLKQLRIAETEKYAHVTFFFNGGVEKPFKNEDRELIPSPNVATYDLQPEMSAPELTDKLVAAIKSTQYDVIICNYANADMVGHSGKMDAAIHAVECLDTCLNRVVTALQQVGGEALITADHGNADKMFNAETGQPHTAHTSEPVPLLYVGQQGQFNANKGSLSDVAPTLLTLMNLDIPQEMTGRPLIDVD
tara:strand:- start:155700 stop:157235 length:1536 start_codon:yes stop_codon:yes gene_type:complete